MKLRTSLIPFWASLFQKKQKDKQTKKLNQLTAISEKNKNKLKIRFGLWLAKSIQYIKSQRPPLRTVNRLGLGLSVDAIRWMELILTMIGRCWKQVFVNCSVGVPQGSVPGPLLFSLYANNQQLVFFDVKSQMYADDTVIFVHGQNRCEVAALLTTVMAKMTNWL